MNPLTLTSHRRGFDGKLEEHGVFPLRADRLDTLQINVGKLCNQACRHCHVDAGPHRTERMGRKVADRIIELLAKTSGLECLDITGGAPELNPNFRYLVREARALGRAVIDRSNLTVFFVEGQADLPEFLASQEVEITASLPCYLEQNVDRQRGAGVFQRSIEALRRLNALGYGRDPALALNLVYNPLGPVLPPPQANLERDYKRELAARYGLVFNRLYTITNMPIARFLHDLRASGREGEYLQTLQSNFNPAAVEGLMCRTLLSVGWDGRLYDCDFNQMLDLPLSDPRAPHIRQFDYVMLRQRGIRTAAHCFGCTAANGSSCTGAVVVGTLSPDKASV